MDALDKEIEAYIAQAGVSKRSANEYEADFRWWTTHCKELGVDPLDAPYSAFQELFIKRTTDGRLYSAQTIETVAAAILYKYTQVGRVPAHKLPENIGDWRTLIRGTRRRTHGEASTKARSSKTAVPLKRNDMAAMLRAMPSRNQRQKLRLALLLLMFDYKLSLDDVRKIRAKDFEVTEDNLYLHGSVVAHDHRERIKGVPWDCTACAVLDCLPEVEDERDPFTQDPFNRYKPFQQIHALSGNRPGTVHPDKSATPWQIAGLRRALSISTGFQEFVIGFNWLRARAWISTSWVCGFRMHSDLVRLPRKNATPQPNGVRLRLDKTKDDPHGTKNVARVIPWEVGPCAAQALTEYLCVRDAYVGVDGALLVTLQAKNSDFQIVSVGTMAANRDLSQLAKLASLPDHFTTYSTRKGYALEAESDGQRFEDISSGLRHTHLRTTSKYVKGDSKKATAKLLKVSDDQ